MKTSATAILCALALCLAPAAQAAYKCTQADGTQSYQDTPCANGSTGSKTALPSVQSVYSPPPSYPAGSTSRTTTVKTKTTVGSAQQAQMQAEINRAAAFNKSRQCNYDRQQLGVLKTQRPVYSTDSNGERHYVPDDKRDSAIAAQQQRVNDACN